MKFRYMLCLILALLTSNTNAQNFQLNIELEIPNIEFDPYHRPYIAVWVETPKRQGVHTLAFWHEQSDWFKDLRQWWRKIGRKNTPNYDAVAGATKKPGTYQLHWDGLLSDGSQLTTGNYVLHIESVREQGSREYLRQPVSLGTGKPQQYSLAGKTELGSIKITIE